MALIDVIKYEGDDSYIIWKHPCEDFNRSSQLIVHENQQAVLFKDGRAIHIFGPGRYSLLSDNTPILTSLFKLATGGTSPFHCEVFFINTSEIMAMKWGTESKISYFDQIYNVPLSIGASGEMSIKVIDSKKVLQKLYNSDHGLDQDGFANLFRSILVTRVKAYFGKVIYEEGISIFELDKRLTDFSEAIRELVAPEFEEYGITLERLLITKIVRPDGDPDFEKIKELHYREYADIKEAEINQKAEMINAITDAERIMIAAQARANQRKEEGFSYTEEREFDVAEKAAENSMVRTTFCTNCGNRIMPSQNYCDKCGTPVNHDFERCSKCGFVLEKGNNYCPNCGTKR